MSIEKLIYENNIIQYGNFTLTSGKKSSYYINSKRLTLNSEAVNELTKEIVLLIEQNYPTIRTIGCVLVGPVTLIGSILLFQAHNGRKWGGFLIRKNIKDHGLESIIEGDIEYRDVILLEDVCTTGITIIKGIKEVEKANSNVKCVISIIDRNEGAEENLKKVGIPYHYLYQVELNE